MAEPKTADPAVIGAWLGLPHGPWPPDHYTLLGLPRGETDTGRIERQAQQRMETVRRYQLANPEMATEALNRLAQAFVCLTDTRSKVTYDRQLLGNQKVLDDRPVRQSELPTRRDPPVSSAYLRTILDTPPVSSVPAMAETVRDAPAVADDPELLSLVEEELRQFEQKARVRAAEAAARASVTPAEEDLVPPPAATFPTIHAIPASTPADLGREADRGLTSTRAMIRRIARTRKLLYAWDAAGSYLNQPNRRLTKPDEAKELHESLAALRLALVEFPSLIGEAGQAGYLVLSLARQALVVRTFQDLLPGQREALARDWNAGRDTLLAYKRMLRADLAAHRRKSPAGKAVRAVRLFVRDHPGVWLAGLGVLALAIALWRQFS